MSHPWEEQFGLSSQPHFAIIIPCFGQPGLLTNATLSALQQDVDCGVVLINDGCPCKETHDICLRIRAAHPSRVLYLNQNNAGPAAARNSGIDVALAVWPNIIGIFFLDQDNLLSRPTIRRLHEGIVESGAHWAFSDLLLIDGAGVVGMAGEYSVLELMLSNYVDTGSLVARQVFTEGIRFDPTRQLTGLEDWDFWLQAARQGLRGVYVPAAGFKYRRSAESLGPQSKRAGTNLSYLRSKHKEWVTPSTCIEREHLESPRYAAICPDTEYTLLFTDPARKRRMPQQKVLTRIAYAGASNFFCQLPEYLIMSSEEALGHLQAHKILHSVLWHLEMASARSRYPVALVPNSRGAYEIQHLGNGNRPALIVMHSTKAIFTQNTRRGPYFIKMPALHVNISPSSDVSLRFHETVHTLRDLAKLDVRNGPVLTNDRGRRKEPLSRGLSNLFATDILFPIAFGSRRIGFAIRAPIGKPTFSYLMRQAEAAKEAGSSLHLIWFGPDWPEGCLTDVFDVVTAVTMPLIELGDDAVLPELLGLLSPMGEIINHDFPELLKLSGHLRSLGVKTYYSISRDISHSSPKIFEDGLQYQDAVEAYFCECRSVRLLYAAMGVPADKLPSSPDVILTQRSKNPR